MSISDGSEPRFKIALPASCWGWGSVMRIAVVPAVLILSTIQNNTASQAIHVVQDVQDGEKHQLSNNQALLALARQRSPIHISDVVQFSSRFWVIKHRMDQGAASGWGSLG